MLTDTVEVMQERAFAELRIAHVNKRNAVEQLVAGGSYDLASAPRTTAAWSGLHEP